MANKRDFYSILGIRRNASPEEVRQAYFGSARRLHPDKNLAPGETELFLEVQEAYEVLSNPIRRARYDASLPPEKDPTLILKQRVLFSRKCILRMTEPQIIYILLEFAVPPEANNLPAPPINLCLVLDRSTSMQGKNLDMVKATAMEILHKLKPQDFFSLVTFSDRAETLIPATQSPELGRMEARIQMLQAGGGTEIFSGLEMGYNEILRNINRSRVNHIILLTDGRTYGDEKNCLSLAEKAAERGIGISGLGIGSEWNDNFLDELAGLTGGSSFYLPRSQDIQRFLLDKFNQLGKIYAKELRLDFERNPGIELRYAFRLQPEPGLLSVTSPIKMGPVVWDTSLKVLLEFVVQPELVQQTMVTIINGTIVTTLANQSPPEQPIPIRLIRPVLRAGTSDLPPMEIVNALSRLKLYRLQEQAHLEATAGDYEQASEHLSRLATHLLAQGERGLAKKALVEADNLQKKKSFSQQGGKEIKYGTRALLGTGRMADEE
jgi:Ca-activated chloride channel homolog